MHKCSHLIAQNKCICHDDYWNSFITILSVLAHTENALPRKQRAGQVKKCLRSPSYLSRQYNYKLCLSHRTTIYTYKITPFLHYFRASIRLDRYQTTIPLIFLSNYWRLCVYHTSSLPISVELLGTCEVMGRYRRQTYLSTHLTELKLTWEKYSNSGLYCFPSSCFPGIL